MLDGNESALDLLETFASRDSFRLRPTFFVLHQIALDMARRVLPRVAGLQISAPFNRGEVARRLLEELKDEIASEVER